MKQLSYCHNQQQTAVPVTSHNHNRIGAKYNNLSVVEIEKRNSVKSGTSVDHNRLMANDERNFRSSYYEKVGCRSVEEKKSLEILLKDKPWDKVKLKQFCLRFTLPGAYRRVLWKVLLGILPAYKESHEFVQQQRQTQYADLMHALRVMRIIDQGTTKPHLFLAMWYLETGRLQYDFNIQMECGLVPIASTLLEMFEDDVDVYWLTKGFYEFVQKFEQNSLGLIDCVRNLLEKEDEPLYRHLIETNTFDSLPLPKWFNCCFAGMLDELALAKIWDKLCGGASKILSFVAAVLLITLRRNILKCRDTEQILKCVQEIPETTEEVIANKAIELWQHYRTAIPVPSTLTILPPISNYPVVSTLATIPSMSNFTYIQFP